MCVTQWPSQTGLCGIKPPDLQDTEFGLTHGWCLKTCYRVTLPNLYKVYPRETWENMEPCYEPVGMHLHRTQTATGDSKGNFRNVQPPAQILKPACETCKISYRPTKSMRCNFKPGFQITWLPAYGFDVVIRANSCFVLRDVQGPGLDQGLIYFFLDQGGAWRAWPQGDFERGWRCESTTPVVQLNETVVWFMFSHYQGLSGGTKITRVGNLPLYYPVYTWSGFDPVKSIPE